MLTIGYLVAEAESVWLTANDGSVLAGHALGYDFESGFGLVQALGRFNIVPLEFGSSAALEVGDFVVMAGEGGRRHSLNARVTAKREFAGYWEYVLDEAVFTSPPHPNWGGSGLIDRHGRLVGIGSLLVRHAGGGGGRHARRQHDRADRPVAADPGRHADAGPHPAPAPGPGSAPM